MDTTAAAAPAETAVLKTIAVDQLHPNPWNRKQFDPQQLAELAESIKTRGVQVRLIVRPRQAGGYEIVDGERRWLAAQEAGLQELPCEMRPCSDEEVAAMDVLLNTQRENPSPLVLAPMVGNYMKEFGKTQEQVAQMFGKTRTWATELIGFIPLVEEVGGYVGAPTLGWDQARALKAASAAVRTQVIEELMSGALKGTGVEKRCNQLRFGAKNKAENTNPPIVQTPDPLVSAWKALESSTPGWSWSAEHIKELTWQLTVDLQSLYPKDLKKAMGQWFYAMAAAMGETKPDPAVLQQLQYNQQRDEFTREIVQQAVDPQHAPKESSVSKTIKAWSDSIDDLVAKTKKEREAAGLPEELTKEEQDKFAEDFLAKHGKML